MVIFGVKTHDVASVKKFVRETKKRLETPDLARNPFSGYIKSFEFDKTERITILKIVPLWPNFSPYVAILSLFPIIFFGGYNNPGLLLIPLIFLGLAFFWTEDFFYLILRIGLKKAGYKGKVKKLKRSVLIDELSRRV